MIRNRIDTNAHTQKTLEEMQEEINKASISSINSHIGKLSKN